MLTRFIKGSYIKIISKSKGVSEVVKITDLLFASTGVIGEDFPYLKIKNRIPELVKKLKLNKINLYGLKQQAQ